MTVAGIIYLHDISSPRVTGANQKDFEIFQTLCGSDASQKVILATTKWDLIRQSRAEEFETQLTNDFWRDMLSHGSRIERFLGTKESARRIVDIIVANTERGNTAVPLRIQEELVDLKKLLPATDAGQKLRQALEQLLGEQNELQQELKREVRCGGIGAHERFKENHERIRSTLRQIKALQVPLAMRLKSFFRL